MRRGFSHGVRNAGWAVALLLTAPAVWPQAAPSMQDGPLNPGSANAAPADTSAPPTPFSDGTYPMAPGITAPKIVQAVPAVYPANVPVGGDRAVSVLSMIIGSDGVPVRIHVVHSAGDDADAAAVDAVEQSKFEPGSISVNGMQQPVPVHTTVRVAFTPDHTPAVPAILQRRYRSPDGSSYDFPPSPIYAANAEYSDEARRKKINGEVIVSTLVTLDGLPSDTRVDRSLGYGLDEAAVKAVEQYRFRPAMKDGKPVAARISVEVSFHLY